MTAWMETSITLLPMEVAIRPILVDHVWLTALRSLLSLEYWIEVELLVIPGLVSGVRQCKTRMHGLSNGDDRPFWKCDKRTARVRCSIFEAPFSVVLLIWHRYNVRGSGTFRIIAGGVARSLHYPLNSIAFC